MTKRLNKLIRFDWAIKNILRNKSNFGILEGFLSELLKENIKINRILESESNQENETDKFNRVDLLAENSKNELIIIEIQNTSELDYLHRLLYGSSKVITENLNLGEAYSKIKKVISVSIVYFDLGHGKDYIYKGTTSFEGIHKKDLLELSEEQKKLFGEIKVEQIFPEYYLLKINKFDKKMKDTLDEWIYFLKYEEIEDNFKAKGLKEAKEKLDVLKLPRREQAIYQRYLENLSYQASMAETINFEINQGINQGINKGLEEEVNKRLENVNKKLEEERQKNQKKLKDEKTELAVIMIKENENIEKIVKYTGLSHNEIEKIKNMIFDNK